MANGTTRSAPTWDSAWATFRKPYSAEGPKSRSGVHETPALIGKPVDEDQTAVLAGHRYMGSQHRSLGDSALGKTPIWEGGQVIEFGDRQCPLLVLRFQALAREAGRSTDDHGRDLEGQNPAGERKVRLISMGNPERPSPDDPATTKTKRLAMSMTGFRCRFAT